MQKVWVLSKTEYTGGQCTGFPERRIILAIFSKKPNMMTVAPYLGRHLSDDMGVAISQVSKLLNYGGVEINQSYEFDLSEVELDTPWEKQE